MLIILIIMILSISRFNKNKKVLLSFQQPFSNHNGGMMSFGPMVIYIYQLAMEDAGDPLIILKI